MAWMQLLFIRLQMFCLNIITFVCITIYTRSVLTLISVFYFNHLYFTGLWMVHRSQTIREPIIPLGT